jgi:hypothetical protein
MTLAVSSDGVFHVGYFLTITHGIPAAKRACIFCGTTPLTREHVFPNWMGTTLAKDPRKLPTPYTFERWSIEGEERPTNRSAWESKRPLDFVARCVCKTCNVGWMSDIEGAAKPIVIPLIQGKQVELDTTSQATLGTWACMKAILAGYTHRPPLTIPQDWRSQLYENRAPPVDGWVVLITAYRGRHPALFASHRLELLRGDDHEPAPDNEGILLSFVVGYLALKVIGVRRRGVSNSGTPFTQVWPTSPLVLLWPPSAHVSDDTLEAFFFAARSLSEKRAALSRAQR